MDRETSRNTRYLPVARPLEIRGGEATEGFYAGAVGYQWVLEAKEEADDVVKYGGRPQGLMFSTFSAAFSRRCVVSRVANRCGAPSARNKPGD